MMRYAAPVPTDGRGSRPPPAWLAGLAGFMLTATPLWRPGQSWWLVMAIGIGCGALMDGTVAALTGLAARHLFRPHRRGYTPRPV